MAKQIPENSIVLESIGRPRSRGDLMGLERKFKVNFQHTPTLKESSGVHYDLRSGNIYVWGPNLTEQAVSDILNKNGERNNFRIQRYESSPPQETEPVASNPFQEERDHYIFQIRSYEKQINQLQNDLKEKVKRINETELQKSNIISFKNHAEKRAGELAKEKFDLEARCKSQETQIKELNRPSVSVSEAAIKQIRGYANSLIEIEKIIPAGFWSKSMFYLDSLVDEVKDIGINLESPTQEKLLQTVNTYLESPNARKELEQAYYSQNKGEYDNLQEERENIQKSIEGSKTLKETFLKMANNNEKDPIVRNLDDALSKVEERLEKNKKNIEKLESEKQEFVANSQERLEKIKGAVHGFSDIEEIKSNLQKNNLNKLPYLIHIKEAEQSYQITISLPQEPNSQNQVSSRLLGEHILGEEVLKNIPKKMLESGQKQVDEAGVWYYTITSPKRSMTQEKLASLTDALQKAVVNGFEHTRLNELGITLESVLIQEVYSPIKSKADASGKRFQVKKDTGKQGRSYLNDRNSAYMQLLQKNPEGLTRGELHEQTQNLMLINYHEAMLRKDILTLAKEGIIEIIGTPKQQKVKLIDGNYALKKIESVKIKQSIERKVSKRFSIYRTALSEYSAEGMPALKLYDILLERTGRSYHISGFYRDLEQLERNGEIERIRTSRKMMVKYKKKND